MSKVLVVEDNELNLKLFHDLLKMKKHDVITSKEGTDALDLAKSQLPDLILMDIQLNGISGLEIIKTLKASQETACIPIIAITAFAMKNDEEKIMQSGCDMYLSKPVSMDSFFGALSKYLK